MKAIDFTFKAGLMACCVAGVSTLLAETNTDTQSPQAINPLPQACGVDMTVPDWMVVNDSDDDKDEMWDFDVEPVPGEKNTYLVTVTGTADKSDATVTVEIVEGADKIDGFWKGSLALNGTVTGSSIDGKEKRSAKSTTFTVPAGQTGNQEFFIEGKKNSEKLKDVKLKATIEAPAITISGTNYKACKKETPLKETTVYQVDIDIDSNNNEKFVFNYGSDDEDKIEASEKAPKKPGKYLWVNSGFNAADNDGSPGWADGFNINPGDTEDDDARDFQFTPILVELKKPFDPTKASIVFSYSASDPAGVTSAAGGGTPDHQFTYTLASGQLRIWKVDGPGKRKKESIATTGDYVPAVSIPWSKLGGGTTVKLYVEAVRPSAALGDLSIKVEVTEGVVKTDDTVNVTSVSLKSGALGIATASTGYGLNGAGTSYTALGGHCVDYESEAVYDPAVVDGTIFPQSDIKVGIMQNAIKTDALITYKNPVVTWRAGVAAGTQIVIPDHIQRQYSFNVRLNDTDTYADPLYDLPGSGQLDANSLKAPGAGKATSYDTPAVPTPSVTEPQILVIGGVSTIVADVKYSVDDASLTHDFVTWATGYETTTENIYPQVERKWELHVKKSAAGAQLPNILAQTANTMVPVRSPLAVPAINNPANTLKGPVPGTTSTVVTHP